MEDKKKSVVYPEVADHPNIVAAREKHFAGTSIKAPFTLTIGGDIIQSHPISNLIDPDVRGILDIVKNSDLSVGNMESNLGDYRNATSAIGGLQGCKEVAKDVKEMGFDLIARCSNHSTDQGVDEMLKGNQYLQEAAVTYAGTGINLEDARSPQYVFTPKGRVGLVAMAMSMAGRIDYQSSSSAAAGMEMAAYGSGNRNGIPGINFLRVTPNIILSPELFEGILKIKQEEYEYEKELMEAAGEGNTGGHGEATGKVFENFFGPSGDPTKRQRIMGQWFQVGEERCGLHYDMNQDDLRLNLRSIRQGKEWSDLMIASIHSHDYASVLRHLDFAQHQPSDFMIELAHKAIDNGADVFVTTGPHLLRGIEIYKGCPIFYSLASFIYQLWGVPAGPDRYTDYHLDQFYSETTETEMNMDMWPPLSITKHPDLKNMESMESALAELKYDDGKLLEIIMHPIEFGYDAPISQRGIPRVPKSEVAQRILKRLQKMSADLGTKLEIEGDLGVIRM